MTTYSLGTSPAFFALVTFIRAQSQSMDQVRMGNSERLVVVRGDSL